ncbi:MAG: helix-turn-helix domain-containing protein [Gammaproteobacteria bacterium]|nr:helix-turn-helix domain-containing protein [Gammaproteobacteria bacterium]
MVSEIEAPLLACVLRHTENNQSRSAAMLGVNRGTLRKKLKNCATCCKAGFRQKEKGPRVPFLFCLSVTMARFQGDRQALMNRVKVKTALVSVSDKTNLEDVGRESITNASASKCCPPAVRSGRLPEPASR